MVRPLRNVLAPHHDWLKWVIAAPDQILILIFDGYGLLDSYQVTLFQILCRKNAAAHVFCLLDFNTLNIVQNVAFLSSTEALLLVRIFRPRLLISNKLTVISLFLCLQFVNFYLVYFIQTFKSFIKFT